MRLRSASLFLVAAATGLVGVAACSSGHHAARCSQPFLGDPQATPTMTFVALTGSGTTLALQESAGAPLLAAPQGGFVIFAGIRATNLDPCNLQITGALRDPTTNKVIGLDARPITLAPDGTTGYGLPADPLGLENWANIPACPSAAATRGIANTSYALEISIQDRGGRTAAGLLHVVPFCNAAEYDYCMASCALNTAGAPVNGGAP